MKGIIFLLLLSACAYQPRNADEAVRMVKEAGGSGCQYVRFTGNSRPYADAEVRSISVYVVGKGPSFLDCLQGIPEAQRALQSLPTQ